MFRSITLFKAPALTVWRNDVDTYVRTNNDLPGTIIHEDAVNLLVDYLKVTKAFFINYGYSRKQLQVFYKDVAQKLYPREEEKAINRQMISGIIQDLGCVSDWVHLHQQNNS
ncbi:hypothetical protein [Aridibaculum aurantiacum]|uniref:hypothetical protein n=1 Tax=Aridibaculum aurantiacum TaxID=2810307 RepID=UPI001A9720EB|nr:hypothetical protein [Aridibaculum aurantiacum]